MYILRVNGSKGGFSSKQNGFRHGKSTEKAVFVLIQIVKSTEHRYALGLLLDISGAFDNLW